MTNAPQPTVEAICAAQEHIRLQLQHIKNRLSFSFSEPLHQQYLDLIKQDMQLHCQLTDLLTQ